MEQKEQNSAVIGFWLVLGASKEFPLLVCPGLIRDGAVEKIESISIEEAWKISVQAPVDTHKKAIMVMIPEIINITNIEKKIGDYKSLWEIESIKAKCESLATKYIKQFRETKV